MEWIAENVLLITALALMAAGIFVLFPKRIALPRSLGWLLTLAGIASFAISLAPKQSPVINDGLFYLFSVSAVFCGILMIVSHYPVYGALWFALMTLSVCGLFLLQSAPFLAAATIIVYAGAIIVTFLFVIMLAQQSGCSLYDQRSRQPLLATIGAFVLLAALLSTIHQAGLKPVSIAETATAQADESSHAANSARTNPLSQPTASQPLGSLHGMGRSLFGDYLFAVELAGTLLLVASIGAILLSPRKGQVT